MDLSAAICDAGMKAVNEATQIWNLAQHNELREEFISALVARNLHQVLRVPVRVEVPYTILWAKVTGSAAIPIEMENKIGGLRADIVIYERTQMSPVAIVEIKIFDESTSVKRVIADLHKADLVDLADHIEIYGGVLVCETNQTLSRRQEALENAAPGARLTFSPATEVTGQSWSWSFGCLTF